MTPQAIEAAITPQTVAIAMVHVLGGAANASAIVEVAERHGLWLFEDTCESLGVRWEGRQVGSFGDMGSFSFYFSHHITTIEGGMIVTNDGDLADLLTALRAHGWVRHMRNGMTIADQYPEIDPRFLFVTTGFNVRPRRASIMRRAFGSPKTPRTVGWGRKPGNVYVSQAPLSLR